MVKKSASEISVKRPKIRRLRSTIGNQIRALLVKHPGIEPQEIVRRLKGKATAQQVYGIKFNFCQKAKKEQRLNSALKRAQTRAENGNGVIEAPFNIKEIIQFQRQINDIGIDRAKEILAAMEN